jgi:hypothetical protein
MVNDVAAASLPRMDCPQRYFLKTFLLRMRGRISPAREIFLSIGAAETIAPAEPFGVSIDITFSCASVRRYCSCHILIVLLVVILGSRSWRRA